MKRFFNDDDENTPEFQFQDDTFEEDEEMLEDGAIAYIDKNDLLEVMQLDLAQTELSNNLLSKAVEIAEKSIFWRFRSAEYKMNQIELIYIRLVRITIGTMEEEGEQDADL